VSTARSVAQRRSVPVRDQPNAAQAAIARQVKDQRSRYTSAVLRSLARSQQGRPTAHIQHLLRSSLTPLGVRLSSATLHQLATDIAAGRPVALSLPAPPPITRPARHNLSADPRKPTGLSRQGADLSRQWTQRAQGRRSIDSKYGPARRGVPCPARPHSGRCRVAGAFAFADTATRPLKLSGPGQAPAARRGTTWLGPPRHPPCKGEPS
jgi:hypothetical protein